FSCHSSAAHRDLPSFPTRRSSDLVFDRHVAGHLDAVGEDDVVPDDAIVGDVDVRHDEAALADRGLARRGGAAVDRAVLADDRAVADLDPGLLALVLEILRIVTDDRPVPHLHAGPDPGVALDDAVG